MTDSVVTRIIGATLGRCRRAPRSTDAGAPFLATPTRSRRRRRARRAPRRSTTSSATRRRPASGCRAIHADSLPRHRRPVRRVALRRSRSRWISARRRTSTAATPRRRRIPSTSRATRSSACPGPAKFAKTLEPGRRRPVRDADRRRLEARGLLVPSAKSLASPPAPLAVAGRPTTSPATRSGPRPARRSSSPLLAVGRRRINSAPLSVDLMKPARSAWRPTQKDGRPAPRRTGIPHLLSGQAALQLHPAPRVHRQQFGACDPRREEARRRLHPVAAESGPGRRRRRPRRDSRRPAPTSTGRRRRRRSRRPPTPTLRPLTPTATPTATATRPRRRPRRRRRRRRSPRRRSRASCTIGGTESRIALQVKNAPIVGNVRVTGPLSGTQTMQFGAQDANGVRQVTVAAASIQFDPIVINAADRRPSASASSPPDDGAGKSTATAATRTSTSRPSSTTTRTLRRARTAGCRRIPSATTRGPSPTATSPIACLESAVGGCNPNNPHLGRLQQPGRVRGERHVRQRRRPRLDGVL